MNTTTKLFAAAAILVMVFATGCASSIEIQSEPPGADVTVDGQYVGQAPTTYTDTAIVGTTHQVTLEKEGYETTNATFSRDGDLNVLALIGGLVCGASLVGLIPFLWVLDYPTTVQYELRSPEGQTEESPAPEVDPDSDKITFYLEPEDDGNFVWDPSEHTL